MAIRIPMALLVAAALATVGLSTGPPAGAQVSAAFTDGAWRGTLSYNALVVFDDEIPASYYGRGSFSASASAGSMSGSFSFQQLTVVRPPELPDSIANSAIEGAVVGPSVLPELAYDVIVVESTSLGITAELEFTAAELGNPTITMVPDAGGCGSISGFWNHEFNAGLTSQGEFIAGREGTWSAHRVGLEPVDALVYESEMTAIEAEVDGLIRRLRDDESLSGPVVFEDVHDLLTRAEALAIDGIDRSECGAGLDPTVFRSRAFAAIAQLLEEVLASPAATNEALIDLMLAGHRSGVFAADPDMAAGYGVLLDDFVASALDSGSTQELLTVYAAAVQLGDTELAAFLAEVLLEAAE